MSTYSVWQYDNEQLTHFANVVKEVVIASLYNDGVIDQEAHDYGTLCGSYVVVRVQKGVFGKWFDKLRGRDQDGFSYITVLKCEPPPPQADPPKPTHLRAVEDVEKD